jgi:Mg2+ and Co2+ transporter CorA
LQADIKRISFEELRHPNITLNNVLLDRREQLAVLREEVVAANESMFEDVVKYLDNFFVPDRLALFTGALLDESERLERFLMDKFQLLVSTVSVQSAERAAERAQRVRDEDEQRRRSAEAQARRQRARDEQKRKFAEEQAQRDRDRDEQRRRTAENQAQRDRDRAKREARLSLEQTARGTRLAWAAGIFLPLNLVTGIYGMNIKEINGGEPKWWAVFSTAAALLIISTICFALFRRLETKKLEQERRKIEEDEG